MRVLITGGSGLVGRNFLEHSGCQQLDVLAPSSSEMDLLDFKRILTFLHDQKPDIVIHAAGIVGGIQANIENPVRFLVENMDMARNLILACRQAGILKLINLGSSCMYPRNASNPLSEEQILQGELEPTNEGYALAKVVAARLCTYITREDSSFAYKTIIPCNLFGRWDKFEEHHSHLIPSIIAKVYKAKLAGQETVEIWGDGNARREFMYAADLADFLHCAVHNFEKLPALMNVGLGHDYSVNEYYQACAEVIEYKGQFVHDLTKPVGMQRKLVDISRQNEFGWKARTDLHSGIRATFEFYLSTRKA